MFTFPLTLEQIDNCYSLNVDKYIFNPWFIMGCFLSGIVVIYILLMMNGFGSNNMSLPHNVANEPNNSSFELTRILVAQLLHNNADPSRPRSYNNFPQGHPGHLDLQKRIRLVSIIRSSCIADNYRYGSASGTMYVKYTYRNPTTSPDMIGVVISVEAGRN